MRLCIQWPRFGPYHLARLRATHAALTPQGIEVVGLETAGYDALYDWRVERDGGPFRREQVFPDRVFEAITPAEMHQGTFAALDRLDPEAVGIMSYGYPDARAALAWCRRRQRVAVLMTDTKADDAGRIGWREHVKRLVVAQYDAALVAGTPHRDYLVHLGFPAHLIAVGYDVVDNEYFAREAAAARRDPEAFSHLPGLSTPSPYFLASSRFTPKKNLEVLLRAYALYRRRATGAGLPPWRLLLLGDGALRPSLEHLVKQDEIEGVTFCGFRQIEEIPAYYGLASAFVHPAATDQWALVVNEAMATALPVLVSTGAGSAYDLVVEGENGYRFDPSDTAALAALLFLMASPGTDLDRMRTRSQQIIAEWPLERFAYGLWRAAQLGRTRATRRLDLTAQAVLVGTNHLARSVTAFHTAEL